MTESQFAVVPLEVVQDRRLTLEHTRVLVALFSFRNKVTNTVWPSRAAIAERTGMHPSNISSATSALVSLGWLLKEGLGGHSKSTRYTLCVPELVKSTTVAQQATVAESATVAQSATPTVAESATTPLADSATRKEQSIEHTNEQKNTARARSIAIAKPDGVTEQTWSDWLQLRKTLRAAVTQTAIDGINREARRAGYTLEQALVTCCANGWRGFKAEWMQQRGLQGQAPRETAYQQQMRERVGALTPRFAAQPPKQSAGDFFRDQTIDVQAQEVGAQRMIGGAR
jgi:hypothetical protein